MAQDPEYLTLFEVARKLRLQVATIRGYVRERRLVASKFGREYRVTREEFVRFSNDPGTRRGRAK